MRFIVQRILLLYCWFAHKWNPNRSVIHDAHLLLDAKGVGKFFERTQRIWANYLQARKEGDNTEEYREYQNGQIEVLKKLL